MSKAVLAVTLVFWMLPCTSLQAQDYRFCGINDTIFLEAESILIALKPDSQFKDSTGTKIFFLDEFDGGEPAYILQDSTSVLGFEIFTDMDNNIRLSGAGDTFYICNTCSIGQKFLFNKERNLYATVKSISYEKFLDKKDLIKTFELAGKPLIKLSKNNGVLQIPALFKSWKDTTDTNTISRHQPMLITEKGVYDFDVNDEFWYELSNYELAHGSHEFNRILEKTILTDSVRYKVYRKFNDWSKGVVDDELVTTSITISIDTVFKVYPYTNKPVLNALPGQIIEYDEGNQRFRPSFYTIGKERQKAGDVFLGVPDYVSYTVIISPMRGYNNYQYYLGAGKSYSMWRHSDKNISTGRYLQYIKKGENVYGWRQVSVNPVAHQESFTFFPNPASTAIILKNNILGGQVMSLHGQVVAEFKPQQERLDISHLSPGAYIVKLSNGMFRKMLVSR